MKLLVCVIFSSPLLMITASYRIFLEWLINHSIGQNVIKITELCDDDDDDDDDDVIIIINYLVPILSHFNPPPY
jgi:hypothetical protein